jgi:hypothetical protein
MSDPEVTPADGTPAVEEAGSPADPLALEPLSPAVSRPHGGFVLTSGPTGP